MMAAAGLHSGENSPSNVDPREIEKFSALSSRWWDPNGPQQPLHVLNPARLDYVHKRCPLPGKRVLDVGCGGGLLSEAMARAGANVSAIDLSEALINVAKLHLLEAKQTLPSLHVDYRVQSVESLADEQPASFDAITCMEMLEHVPEPASIINACAHLLKPGGQLFVSTINRTPAAFALAIVGAEYIARLLPKGTHDYQQFIRPSELSAWLRGAELSLQEVCGLHYDPLRQRASLGSNVSVNYLLTAIKL